MPRSAPTRCTDPQCGELATYQGRCEAHRRKAWANKSRRNQLIDPTLWRVLSTTYLSRYPDCAVCGTDTDCQVDHITEVADGGALYDEQNFQTLCGTCHIEKTRLARQMRRALKEQAEF